MSSGEWMRIIQIQRITGFKRKRVRNLLRDARVIGIVEKSSLITSRRDRRTHNRWGEPVRPNARLAKKEAKFRMDMSKVYVEITEEDPSD